MKILKNLTPKNRIWYILSVLIVVAVFVYWEVASSQGWVNKILLSSPSKIVSSFGTLIKNGSLQKHIWVSFQRVMTGFAIGSALGIMAGFLLSSSKKLSILTGFALGLIRPIPSMALFPLFILWFGIGEASKIVVIAFVSFWPTFLNTEEGVRQTDPKLMELAAVLKKDRITRIRTIILPSTIPYIFAGLRLSISRAWGGVVIAEMLAASAGVGFMIQYARDMSQTPVMFVGVIVIAIIGYIIDLLLEILYDKVCYWKKDR